MPNRTVICRLSRRVTEKTLSSSITARNTSIGFSSGSRRHVAPRRRRGSRRQRPRARNSSPAARISTAEAVTGMKGISSVIRQRARNSARPTVSRYSRLSLKTATRADSEHSRLQRSVRADGAHRDLLDLDDDALELVQVTADGDLAAHLDIGRPHPELVVVGCQVALQGQDHRLPAGNRIHVPVALGVRGLLHMVLDLDLLDHAQLVAGTEFPDDVPDLGRCR